MSGFHHTHQGLVAAVVFGLTSPIWAVDLDVPASYPTIQDAINAAVDGDRVMIDPGTYFEAIDFLGKQITVRSVDNDPTTVTIDAAGLNTHAVEFTGVSTSDAKLAGVTVTGGNHPITGGGVNIVDGSPTIRRCIITGNHANTGGGINVGNGDNSPEISQCLIYENTANGAGASLYLSGTGTPEILNCVIVDNESGPAYGALVAYTTVVIRNTVVRNNVGADMIEGSADGSIDAQYSNIMGGWSGAGNIDAPHEFVDAVGRDFRLTQDSPGIDAGDNGGLPGGIAQDIGGNRRYLHDPYTPNTGTGGAPLIDIGAYEFVPRVRYVDQNATGDGSGLTWEDAYTDLVDAQNDVLSNANVDDLWVAAGTYFPDEGTGDPGMSFAIEDNQAWYGGFAGGELWLDDQDPSANQTTLSGAIGLPGDVDNTVDVVEMIGTGSMVLDGFTVQKAAFDGVEVYAFGEATIRDCWIRQNERYGVFAVGLVSGASIRVNRCRINRNAYAGAHLFQLDAEVTNCVIAGNDGQLGGLIVVTAELDLVNSTIYGNGASSLQSGGVYAIDSTLNVRNSIIWGNTGIAVDLQDQNLFVSGSVSTDVTYSTVEGQTYDSGGAGTNGVDPQFRDLDGPNDVMGDGDDDFRLSPRSHAIDSGNNTGLENMTLDWHGDARFQDDAGMPNSGTGTGAIIDRGAVEFDGQSCAYDCNDDGTVDVIDMLFLLGGWGDVSTDPTCDYQGEAGGDGFIDVLELLGLLAAWGGC